MRRTCSGVMGEFAVAAGRRGGVVGRSASAILNFDHGTVEQIRAMRLADVDSVVFATEISRAGDVEFEMMSSSNPDISNSAKTAPDR